MCEQKKKKNTTQIGLNMRFIVLYNVKSREAEDIRSDSSAMILFTRRSSVYRLCPQVGGGMIVLFWDSLS